MKKAIFIFLSIVCLISFFGCESKTDEDRLNEIDTYLKEGNYSAAKSAKRSSHFDDKVNYYIAESKYYLAKNEYGDALYHLKKGTKDSKVKNEKSKLETLNNEIDKIIKDNGKELKEIRKKERKDYVKLFHKLNGIQDTIDTELDKYYNRKSSKAKLLRVKKELRYDIPSRVNCQGRTDEYSFIINYYSYVKKEIKYLEKFAKKDDDKDLRIEEKLLKYQEYAKENKEKFENIIKSEPELY